MPWAGFDGRAYTREQWAAQVAQTTIFPDACRIIEHATGVPNLAQSLAMNETNYIANTQAYYEQKLRWAHGPHFFAAHDVIFGFSALGARGTHCSCANADSIGGECMGNRNTDNFADGPGKDALDNWHFAAACLFLKMGRAPGPATLIPHAFCAADGHFQCPIENWERDWRIKETQAIIAFMNTIGKLVQAPAIAAQAKPIYAAGSAAPVGSVAWIQAGLNSLGFLPNLLVDGDCGPATKAAIAKFQSSRGLFVDGIAGPKTIAALEIA